MGTPHDAAPDPRRVPRPRRVALYSHDTMGCGHMRRNLLIAQALAVPPVSAAVPLISGAREASWFSIPPGVDCLTLPALAKAADGTYHTRTLGVPLTEVTRLRGRAVAAALDSFRPD